MTPELTQFQEMPPKWLPPNSSEERFARKVMTFLNLSLSHEAAKRQQELLITFYRQAVAEERERCAKVCEDTPVVEVLIARDFPADEYGDDATATLANAAAAIRGFDATK